MSEIDHEKLRRLQLASQNRTGGKSVPRRKVAVKVSAADDKKLQAALKKLNVQPFAGVEEVNMFKDDNSVLHFSAPKVHAALPSNVLAIYGNGVDKDLTELVPGILNQLGPDAMANLRRIAESYQQQQGLAGLKQVEEDDEPPALVSAEESKLDELN